MSPPAEERPTPGPTGLGLSLAQVVGSALAAVSGAFLASWLGVTGTLTGVAVGSVVGTVGSASYTHSLRRSHQVVWGDRPVREGRPPSLPWPRLAAAAAVVAALGLGTLTLVETLAGEPVSSLTTGSRAEGTTLGEALGAHHQDGGPGTDTGPTQPPGTTSTPSPSPTDPVATDGTVEPTPSGDPSPTADPPPSESPTPAPGTGAATPSAPVSP